jgi:hypothetical protein
MGFSTGWGKGQVFTDKWVDALAKASERFMPDRVEFLDPVTRTTILADCPARIQPIQSAVSAPNGVNDTQRQAVRVSIPISLGRDLDLRPHHRAAVVTCHNMPILRNYLFVASETLDSGNAVERTFVFTVDLEIQVS